MQASIKLLMVMALALSGSACFTLNAYHPDSPDASWPAHVSGDYHLRAGGAVNVYLRSVDDKPLHFWQHAADVEAGAHRLLVDCSVEATSKLSRHELNVTLDAGVHYRLSAEANDQEGCTQVMLDEQ